MYVCVCVCVYTDDVQLLHRIFLIYDQCTYSPLNRNWFLNCYYRTQTISSLHQDLSTCMYVCMYVYRDREKDHHSRGRRSSNRRSRGRRSSRRRRRILHLVKQLYWRVPVCMYVCMPYMYVCKYVCIQFRVYIHRCVLQSQQQS